MKKYLILIAAAIAALVSCSKVEENSQPDQAISFQVTSYRNTKAEGDPADYKVAYQNVPFGAYAWYKGVSAADNTTFMTNQKVSYKQADNTWTPEGITYYWPKTGSLDFICYSPFSADAKGISIAEDKIGFSAYTVGTDDLMYGDKAVGQKANTTTYNYNGVPVLFHHALARVAFQVKAAYLEKKAETGDKTRWEISVSKVTLKDVRTTGSLELPLSGTAWTLPANKVWTATDARKDIALETKDLKTLTAEAQALGEPMLVLPQLLAQGPQIEVVLTVKTYHDAGKGEELILTEKDIKATAFLALDKLPQWGINQDITYILSIAPTAGSGSDPENPDKPVDPTDPTLKDAEITFDPALVDWEVVDAKATIHV